MADINYPDGTVLTEAQMPADFQYVGIAGDGTTALYTSQSTGKIYTDDQTTGGYMVLGDASAIIGSITTPSAIPKWLWIAGGAIALMMFSKKKKR